MNKHDAVWEWLLSCPYIRDMFFAFGLVESGATQLVPSESELGDFIDGSRRMRYTASLVRYIALSQEPNDVANINSLVDFEKVKDWVEEQSGHANFPDFPEDCIVDDVRVLPSSGGFAIDQDMVTAKYIIEFQIDYLKERRDYNG